MTITANEGRCCTTLYLLALAVCLCSCNESLPPRQDPQNVFGQGARAQYICSDVANNVLIDIALTNNFDETLSDTVHFSGTVVVTSERDPSVHKTFALSLSNLVHGIYDSRSGVLTINPGDSVVIRVIWSLDDDAGASLSSTLFHYHVDPDCAGRLVSSPETFSIVSRTRLFAPLGLTESRTVFQMSHFSSWVSPKDCHPL
ncbi:MAG TPA: hypothetical protein VI758_00945 [Bacteroidota bacterium]